VGFVLRAFLPLVFRMREGRLLAEPLAVERSSADANDYLGSNQWFTDA
jgi:hypothetical protein